MKKVLIQEIISNHMLNMKVLSHKKKNKEIVGFQIKYNKVPLIKLSKDKWKVNFSSNKILHHIQMQETDSKIMKKNGRKKMCPENLMMNK